MAKKIKNKNHEMINKRLILLEDRIMELTDKIRNGEADDVDYYLLEKYRREASEQINELADNYFLKLKGGKTKKYGK